MDGDHFKDLFNKASQGDAEAQYKLGTNYYNGGNITEKDFEKAVYWFERAADQGYAQAQYNTGVFYYNGYGVDQDIDEAIYWFKKAAKQKFEEAVNILESLGYDIDEDENYYDGNQ